MHACMANVIEVRHLYDTTRTHNMEEALLDTLYNWNTRA